MTGPELRAIRLKLGLTLSQMGRALGYAGNNPHRSIYRLEGEYNGRTITIQAERLAILLGERGKVPKGWLE